MARVARTRVEPVVTEALLLKSVPFGEADLVVGLFTERLGRVSALARSARRSSKRFAGLEPLHGLRVSLEARGGELMILAEVSIERPRLYLPLDLDRLEAAGQALRWVRGASAMQTPEPATMSGLSALLDALDAPSVQSPRIHLAAWGLRWLSSIGWGLELGRCVACGRACAPSAAACVDPARGGLVCRTCGGARLVLRAEPRRRIVGALAGDDSCLDEDSAERALELVEAALRAHVG